MSYNKPSIYTPLEQPSSPNPNNTFIAPNRSDAVTQTQEEDTLELLTSANAVTETKDSAPTTVDTEFHKYLDYTFNKKISAASLTPNEYTRTPIINYPHNKRFRVSSYHLTEDIHLRNCDGIHMFQSNPHSKSGKLDRVFFS